VVKVDGQDWIPRVRYGEGCLKWKVVMQPAESRKVEIGYASRGLQYLRYKPGNMRERCLVAMTLHGVPPGRLDYPIGSMPPLEDRSKLPGDNYTLHWDLSRAVSNYDIGIAMPRAEQPGYFVTQVLGAAPIGLVLLALMLLLTRWLIAGRLDLLPVSLALIAFYIGNALLANLNDVIASFALAFAVGTVPLGVAVCVFWWTMDGRGFLAAQSAALYLLLALIYPLLALSSASGTLLYFLYTILFIYVVGLVAWRSHRAREGHLLTAQ
jgi:hypothetical protein